MTSTLTSACPLCGLRYESKPLLELHIREDHRPRRAAQPGRRDPGGTAASAPPGRPSRTSSLATRPSRAVKEVTAMTAARHPRTGPLMTAARHAFRAVRYVNGELTLAGEAIVRSARAPQPRPRLHAYAAGSAQPDTAIEGADRAA
jgi:hypothetical protein